MQYLARAALVAAVALCVATPARANVIGNGGFETGTWADWTKTPAPSGSILVIAGHGHSGRDAAWFGAIGSFNDHLSQTFATVPGETYILDFWLAQSAFGGGNSFIVSWNHTPILTLVNAPRTGYREYTFRELATGWTTDLDFAGRNLRDYFYLDDVTVSTNPEPGSVVLLGSGLLFLISYRRRRSGRIA